MLDSTDKDNVSTTSSTGNDAISILNSTDKDDVSMTNDLKSDETGISTPQSEVMMASFRIDRQLWAKFGAIAKRERLTATDVLTDYIQRCTDKDKTEYAISIDTDSLIITDTYDTDKLNDAVMMAVSTLSVLSKDDVSTMISTKLEFLRTEVSILAELNKKTLLELEYQRDEIEALKKFDAIG
jgi:hypothetical protein